MHGIEINPYAHELASVVVWIGYIQWLTDNGFGVPDDPILKPIYTIERKDAILSYDDAGKPVEPEWPAADVIVGNPPFLGGNRIRQGLGDEYVEDLFRLYEGRVPAFADLVCYWFERARRQIAAGTTKRAGLLATQGIRGGVNRRVLERIKDSGDIFWAQSDRNWILEGATVRISMVGFDGGEEASPILDGVQVRTINADLTTTTDTTKADRLNENLNLSFQGASPKGSFDIESSIAKEMLSAPLNVNGRSNGDVVRPVVSGVDIVQGDRGKWTIDFGLMTQDEAAAYEMPFGYIAEMVFPIRSHNRRQSYAQKWWQYAEPRPGMRAALAHLRRFIATPRISKHRIFVWIEPNVLPNDSTIVIARADDYFFGALHSKPHELWALRLGTALTDRPRYTPTTTFETFPFPWPPGWEPVDDPRVRAIGEAAKKLVSLRDAWLNPPKASEKELKERTLTKLYNQRPTWLDHAHRVLDRAVLDAYGWPHELTDEQILERLLALNLERAGRAGSAAGND